MAKSQYIEESAALPGREALIDPGERHAVFGDPLKRYDDPGNHASSEVKRLVVGMGCFWGAERIFWQHDGVLSTAVGYAGGLTPNPTYKEVCSGMTGHTEVVQIYFDPQQASLGSLLKLFWERHDPTQGMRQGNDIGTQYRSALYWCAPEDETVIRESLSLYQSILTKGGAPHALGREVTTELRATPTFYYAEEFHQQYLHKNPNGYCGLRGTGAVCPL